MSSTDHGDHDQPGQLDQSGQADQSGQPHQSAQPDWHAQAASSAAEAPSTVGDHPHHVELRIEHRHEAELLVAHQLRTLGHRGALIALENQRQHDVFTFHGSSPGLVRGMPCKPHALQGAGA